MGLFSRGSFSIPKSISISKPSISIPKPSISIPKPSISIPKSSTGIFKTVLMKSSISTPKIPSVSDIVSSAGNTVSDIGTHVGDQTGIPDALDKIKEIVDHTKNKFKEAGVHAENKLKETGGHLDDKIGVTEHINDLKIKTDEIGKNALRQFGEIIHQTGKKLDETGKYLGDRTGVGKTYENLKKEADRFDDNLVSFGKKIKDIGGEIGDTLNHWYDEIENASELGYSLAAGVLPVSLYDFKDMIDRIENNLKNLDLKDISLENIGKELKNLVNNLIDTFLCPIVHSLALAYFSKLIIQTGDKFYHLKNDKVEVLKPYYPNIDIGKIKFSFSSFTKIEPKAIAFAPTTKNQYIFINEVDYNFPLLCHEIQHIVQYKRLGGFTPFMKKYCKQIRDKVISSGTVNVHDLLELEKEADAKAEAIKISTKISRSDFELIGDAGLISESIEYAQSVLDEPFTKNTENSLALKGGSLEASVIQVKINNVAEDVVTTVHSVIAETVKNKITESVQEIVEDSIQEIVSDTVQDMVSNIVQDMDKSLENIADTVGDRVKKRFS